MKPSLLFTALVFALFFSACQKEYSFDSGGLPAGGGNTGGTAIYSLGDSSGSCSGAIVSGTYTAGTATTSTNTVILEVDVDSVGSYTITTSSSNGISFAGSGTFTGTGSQPVMLTGTGTPVAAGNFNFSVGTSGCTFSVTVAADTTTNPPPTGECKACIYTPFCVGSWFKYKLDYSGNQSTMTNSYTTETDTTVNGAPYRKITGISDNGTTTTTNTSYFNCTNGVSTVFAYNVTGVGGTTLAFIKSTPIKANEPVGATWSEVIQNQANQDVTNAYTIIEKGISRTVLGRVYADVIHIELRQSIDMMGTPIEAGVTQYYYAKGVGVIETTNEAFGMSSSQLLEDYFIP